MQAGNAHYRLISDIPETVPVFPLSAALLLPGTRMPLNIFEPRYLQMIDEALAGARVIGMSADDLPTLKRFSVEACRNAFPVATATPDVIKAYDVSLKQKPGLTDRTSYVIDRSGKITFVHSDLDWSEHVAKTLAAVKALKR